MNFSAWLAEFCSPNGRVFKNVIVADAEGPADAADAAWQLRRERNRPTEGWRLLSIEYLGKYRELRPGQVVIYAIAGAQAKLHGLDLGRTVVVSPENQRAKLPAQKRLPLGERAQLLGEEAAPPPAPAAPVAPKRSKGKRPAPAAPKRASKEPRPSAEEALVFSFGSNLYLPQLQQRCPGMRRVGAAELPGWELGWAGHSSRWDGPVATIAPRRGGVVRGGLVAMSRADLEALDTHEGEGQVYQRVPVRVRLRDEQGERTVEAWTYVHRDEPRSGAAPSARYVARIAAGLAMWGWDLERLDAALPEHDAPRGGG